jgi:hypothetical protein
MRRLCTLVVTAAALGMVNTPSQAAGSWQKKPMFDHVVKGGLPTPNVKLPPAPEINPAQFFSGCGRGRVRDPQNHLCYGPGNVGH